MLHAAAGERRRGRGERRRRVDGAVGVDAERIPAGVAEVVLHAGRAVDPAARDVQVVERDAAPGRLVRDREDGAHDASDLGEESVPPLVRRARAGAPTSGAASPAPVSAASRVSVCQLAQVLLRDDRRERDVEAPLGEEPDAVERLAEGSGPADRIVGPRGSRAVDRDLELEALARTRVEPLAARPAEERRVRQNDQLASALLGDEAGGSRRCR